MVDPMKGQNLGKKGRMNHEIPDLVACRTNGSHDNAGCGIGAAFMRDASSGISCCRKWY